MTTNSLTVSSYSMKPFVEAIEKVDKENTGKSISFIKFWEDLAVLSLIGSIVGQILVGGFYIPAMLVWLVANVVMTVRDFVLKRPFSEKIKDGGLCILTVILIVLRVLGIY